MKKQVIIGLGITVLLLLSGVAIRHAIPDRKEVQNSQITVRTEIRDTQSEKPVMQVTETQAEEPVEPEEVSVSGLRAQREDAGHIKIQWEDDSDAVPGTDSYGYAEGDFTLQVALALKEKLEEDYGIAVSMTRDSGSISIGGYTDASLDSGHNSLRGAYAAEQGSVCIDSYECQ